MKTLELYNEVGAPDGITLDAVRSFLNESKGEDITFKISSLGGNLAQAITIHNLIKAYDGNTTAQIVGLTASAGTVIAIACDNVVMSDNALFLIHNGWTTVTGNTYELAKTQSELQKNDALMVKMYKDKTGLPEAKIKELMAASDWLMPHEAKELGFVNAIETMNEKIAAHINASLLSDSHKQKLEQKMKLFGKEKKEPVFALALKDGKQCIINAEAPATGVEVQPLGAAGLEDGSYELADGRTIIVSGGIITEVTEGAAEPEAAVKPEGEEMKKEEVEAIISAFKGVVIDIVKPLQDEIAAMKSITSKAAMPKNTQVSASVEKFDVLSRVTEKANELRKQFENERTK